MKKKRILYTIPNFNTAGSGKVVYDLVRYIDPDKFEIDIACANNKGALYKVVESLGKPIHVFDTKTHYKPYHNLLFRIWKISKFYRKHRYDIIHSWQWSSDWTEALAARLVGKKWIYTKKAMGHDSKHWKIKSYLASFIITINKDMRYYFPNKKNQVLIPLGIDVDHYNPALFPKVPGTNLFTIITVANLVSVKNIDSLIHAVNSLRHLPIQLHILGNDETPYANTLKQLVIALDLEARVLFLGKHLDVRPFLASADLYVISSNNEGMPMALVEAMSMGIPVLGSDVSGINYVLADYKELLFPASNATALVKKIKMLYDTSPEDRLLLGKSLRDYCETHFSMKSFISAHENLYLRMLK